MTGDGLSRDVTGANDAPRSDTRTLRVKLAPPSNDAAKRTFQLRLSGCSRRSYHVTPTTPSWFTAISGMNWSVVSLDTLSLIRRDGDQVRPSSTDDENRIWLCPERRSGHTT